MVGKSSTYVSGPQLQTFFACFLSWANSMSLLSANRVEQVRVYWPQYYRRLKYIFRVKKIRSQLLMHWIARYISSVVSNYLGNYGKPNVWIYIQNSKFVCSTTTIYVKADRAAWSSSIARWKWYRQLQVCQYLGTWSLFDFVSYNLLCFASKNSLFYFPLKFSIQKMWTGTFQL